MADDPEPMSLLNGYTELLEAMRWLTTLGEAAVTRRRAEAVDQPSGSL